MLSDSINLSSCDTTLEATENEISLSEQAEQTTEQQVEQTAEGDGECVTEKVEEKEQEISDEEEETIREAKVEVPTIVSNSSAGTCPDTLPDDSFASLSSYVSEKTMKGILDMGFTNMTKIQHKTVLPLLKGRSVIWVVFSRTIVLVKNV